jgi:hypothetical protein
MDYNWKRFWSPRDRKIYLSDDQYLPDPESQFGKVLNPDLLSSSEIAAKPCLVLLGEPGIGKSRALNTAYDQCLQECRGTGDLVEKLDLRSYGDEKRLVDDLFNKDATREWRAGGQRFHLFIDSLDECLLRIDTLASLLPEELAKQPVERLSLRIACRTAVWPAFLERELQGLWKEANLGVYELVPLRELDVSTAAVAEGLEVEAFLTAIAQAEVVPFATRPVTLRMLMNIFKRGGGFPATKWELYEKGIRLLAEEVSESRVAARNRGRLSLDRRMDLAGRIAAVSIFCNRFAVWIQSNAGDMPPEDVGMVELTGPDNTAGRDRLEITTFDLEEVLDTGLFSSRGAGRMGWSHQTYAEFLAARYVLQHDLATPQIVSFLRHPGESSGKVVPQLEEVAAWIAIRRTEIFDAILPADPTVLLRSDIATGDDQSRDKLVTALLGAFESNRAYDIWSDLRSYRKLANSKLADRLLPYIQNRDMNPVARQAAMLIGESCGEKKLAEALLVVALNAQEDSDIRAMAISALSSCGEVLQQLRPLVTGVNDDDSQDPNDEVKGSALKLLWPRFLTTAELFSVLSPTKRPELHGSYSAFIASGITEHLQPADMAVALDWVERQDAVTTSSRRSIGRDYLLSRLSDEIVLAAFRESGEHDSVRQRLAEILINRLRAHYLCAHDLDKGKLEEAIREKTVERRLLIETLVSTMNDQRGEAFAVSRMIPTEDFRWLIESAVRCDKQLDTRADTFARLAEAKHLNFETGEVLETIYSSAQESQAVAKQFAWLLRPVELESQEAKEAKRLYYLTEQPAPQRPTLDPPTNVRIERCLDLAEASDWNAFWQLNYWLAVDANLQINELEPDITKLHGWTEASDSIRSRIVRVAAAYLRLGEPGNGNWVREQTLQRPAFAGYRALRLLANLDPAEFQNLSSGVWKRWTVSVVCYPADNSELAVQQNLIARAYGSTPDETLQAFDLLIESDFNADANRLRFDLSKVSRCWKPDGRVAQLLLGKLAALGSKAEHMGAVLEELLQQDVDEALDFAREHLKLPISTMGEDGNQTKVVTRTLLRSAQPETFEISWAAIQSDDDFGREVFLDFANDPLMQVAAVLSKLNEAQLEELFTWLERNFPRAKDPDHGDEAYWVGPRESVAHFRGAVLQALVARSTPNAVQSLRRIQSTHQHLRWIYRLALNAEANMMRATWTPLRASELLAIVRDSQLRLVRNARELVDVVIESLHRLQNLDLKAQSPRAPFLWNEDADGKFRPRSEPEISNYVKTFFEQDLSRRGIIVNREVEIHGPEGLGKTDVHIDAVSKGTRPGQFERLKAVIELKGCWHQEVRSAMKDQLLDQYLSSADCRDGIFLVAWCDPQRWDPADYRRDRVPKWTLEEAREFFRTQAETNSGPDRLVRAFVLDCSF